MCNIRGNRMKKMEIANASRLEQLTEDYTRIPVPPHVNTSGLQVAVILCAIGITLPVLAYGAWLAQDKGFGSANLAFWVGCWIVAGISLFTGLVGARSRLSTYMILQFSFGRRGAKIVNLLMAIILLGWYAATCEEFGKAISDALKTMLDFDVPKQLSVLVGSILMTLTTIFGFKAIEKFSRYSVPLLVAFMIYVTFKATGDGAALNWSLTASSADTIKLISIVIGLMVIAAVLMPDFTRYCPNDKQSHIASLVGIGITFPMILVMAAIPAIRTGQADLIAIMEGMGVVFIALFVLVFATWSTNITNLYSSTLTLSTFMTKMPSWKITVLSSIVATVCAVAGITDHFTTFLLFIGIATTPLAGVYVIDYFLIKKGDYDVEEIDALPSIGWLALIAWATGSVIGYLTENSYFSLTKLSSIDALAVAAVVYFVLAKMMHKSAMQVGSSQNSSV